VEVSSKVDKTALFDEAPGLMVACGLALRNFDNEQN
jgi:Tfp pilus assembly PilM family ATPase